MTRCARPASSALLASHRRSEVSADTEPVCGVRGQEEADITVHYTMPMVAQCSLYTLTLTPYTVTYCTMLCNVRRVRTHIVDNALCVLIAMNVMLH